MEATHCLDVACALSAGASLPVGGMFRAEDCIILERHEDGWFTIQLTDNHLFTEPVRVPALSLHPYDRRP